MMQKTTPNSANSGEVRLTGKLDFVFTNKKTGKVRKYTEKNMVVTAGKIFIATLIKGDAIGLMSHMAIGESTQAEALGDTTLGDQGGPYLQTAIVALDSTTLNSNTVIYVASFGAGVGDGTITDAGIFNGASSGVMLCRSKFDPKVKGSSDSLTITWTLTIN